MVHNPQHHFQQSLQTLNYSVCLVPILEDGTIVLQRESLFDKTVLPVKINKKNLTPWELGVELFKDYFGSLIESDQMQLGVIGSSFTDDSFVYIYCATIFIDFNNLIKLDKFPGFADRSVLMDYLYFIKQDNLKKFIEVENVQDKLFLTGYNSLTKKRNSYFNHAEQLTMFDFVLTIPFESLKDNQPYHNFKIWLSKTIDALTDAGIVVYQNEKGFVFKGKQLVPQNAIVKLKTVHFQELSHLLLKPVEVTECLDVDMHITLHPTTYTINPI